MKLSFIQETFEEVDLINVYNILCLGYKESKKIYLKAFAKVWKALYIKIDYENDDAGKDDSKDKDNLYEECITIRHNDKWWAGRRNEHTNHPKRHDFLLSF